MADFTIRPVNRGDLEAVHAIERESFPAPWRREFFESELDAAGRFTIVATRDQVVIGYVFAMWIFDEMHVNKIAVTGPERRKGIAQALMDRCFDFAREHNIETISLEVRESNHAAQAFYRQLGFASVYARPRYYPDLETAVVMTCRV
ncbi:MAG TPA: ribosomal protein S18-alanine N-acetyltransferase, partial [Thermoanaerobaculia bacterium]|nr:ribosomal protein S18-alanine N-acetyltransferase [Thermoanaerobaculia bacterium]